MRRLMTVAAVGLVLAACGGGGESATVDQAAEAAASAAASLDAEASAAAEQADLPDFSGLADEFATRDECLNAIPVEMVLEYDIGVEEPIYSEALDAATAVCETLPAEPDVPDLSAREGKVEGFCDVSLNGDLDLNEEGRYKALATIEAINTGDVDIDVEVWVEFIQLGAEPLRFTQTVSVAAGETETAYFDENITSDQWNRNLDAGGECDIGGDMTLGAAGIDAMIRSILREPGTCDYVDSLGQEAYIAELEGIFADLWRDDFADVVTDVIEDEC